MAHNKEKFDPAKAQRAAARKAHFANGGTLATWRGRASAFTDRRKRANKRACRGQVQVGGDA